MGHASCYFFLVDTIFGKKVIMTFYFLFLNVFQCFFKNTIGYKMANLSMDHSEKFYWNLLHVWELVLMYFIATTVGIIFLTCTRALFLAMYTNFFNTESSIQLIRSKTSKTCCRSKSIPSIVVREPK